MAKILEDIFPLGLKLSDLKPPPLLDATSQLRAAMAEHGIPPPDVLLFDGALHRFSTNDKRSDLSGWYVAHDDGRGPAAGAFGDWRQGVESTWRADIGRELSIVEQMKHSTRMRDLKIQRERELAIIRQEAAEDATETWQDAPLASDEHQYLAAKKIANPGLRLATDGRLIAPMYLDGELSSLQMIAPDGTKRFLKGGKAAGAWWAIGGAITPDSKRVYICEGVATAASIFEAVGRPVAIAYSAGNLKATTKAVREIVGIACQLVVVADNDSSGIGEREGMEACNASGATLILPPTTGDANDYKNAGGNLSHLLEPPAPTEAEAPSAESWLIPADDFAAQPAPIRWLIKHWVQSQALCMIHGPSGGGKTFVLLDMMLSMASGKPDWCGHRVKPASIVYLAGEGHHGLRGRIAAWKHSHGAGHLDMWLSRSGCDLNTPAGYLKTVEAIKAAGAAPSIIAVDTLHRFLSGDENSAQDAKTMLDACAGLMREFNCSVVLVHHTGVSEEAQHRARGSSAWRGALDIEISVIPGKNDQPLEIVQRKSKDAEMAKPIYAELKQVTIPGWIDEDGEPVTSAVLDPVSAPESQKFDSVSATNMKRFDRAWMTVQCELLQDRPYVSRSAMLAFLVSNDGFSKNQAESMIKPDGKFIGELVNSGQIQALSNGWMVVDNVWTSALMMMGNKL